MLDLANVAVDHGHAVEIPADGRLSHQRVDLLVSGTDFGHQSGDVGVGVHGQPGQDVLGAFTLHVRLVQQRQGPLA